ncbi:MAG TPA: hypothetical protein VKA26_15525 [Ignavibacteriaceae bacterium]|nr:hypothetical protein [Ignavibacteriaceae bacterium]
MKFRISNLLFAFGILSLGISIYQFSKGTTTEAILSIVYFLVFFISGIVSKSKNRKGESNAKQIL